MYMDWVLSNWAHHPNSLKKIETNGISHLDFLLCPNSDQGTHFTTAINHLFAKPQRYSLKFHALYHLIFNPQGKWNIKM